ncbi:MAG: hypothetical protein PVSMB4_10310 [Ktedonobacterales bacterium]
MANYIFDSNVLVKRYFREPGHAWVNRECSLSVNTIYISELALTEVVCTLHKKARKHSGFRRVRDTLISAFRRDAASGEYKVRRLASPILEAAGDLAAKHAISSLDAIQLSGALELAQLARRVGASVPIFVSADQNLRRFAKREGFDVLNPEDFALPTERLVRKRSWRERLSQLCKKLAGNR